MKEKASFSHLIRSLRQNLQGLQGGLARLEAELRRLERGGLGGEDERSREQLDLEVILRSMREMATRSSQGEILEVFLAETCRYVDRAILFRNNVSRYDAWRCRGFAADPCLRVSVEEPDSMVIQAARRRQPVLRVEGILESFPWLGSLGPLPSFCLCIPLCFSSHVPLVLYADSKRRIDLASVELLAHMTTLYLQNHYQALLLGQWEEEQEEPTDIDDTEEQQEPEEAQTDAVSEVPVETVVEPSERDLRGLEEPVAEAVTEAEPAELTAEEEEAMHSEARRLARLLVAEIKLYNEAEVEEGRQEADLYRRLRSDIDRSRNMYEKRVHPAIRTQADYFHTELVRVLAHENPELMGSEYPGTEVSNPIDHRNS